MEAPTNQQTIDFVIREARLIDMQGLDEWLDLFADRWSGARPIRDSPRR